MFAALGSEDTDQGSFEVLFEKLQVMKGKNVYIHKIFLKWKKGSAIQFFIISFHFFCLPFT